MGKVRVYAAMRIDQHFNIESESQKLKVKLPDGHYVIPCFSDYDKAKEVAGEDNEVMIFEIEDSVI